MPDEALQMLVNIINRVDGEYGITLTVGGHVITGNMISNSAWMKANSDRHTDASGSGGAALSELFASHQRLFEEFREDDKALEKAEDEGLPSALADAIRGQTKPSYIHLRDVWFVGTTDKPETNNGAFWRGRLKDVSGWVPGRMGVS